jgi:CRP-like cAMP-binding protein
MLVVGGLLRVYMSFPEGRQVTIRYARPGDVLGIAVLVGGPADVGVQTLAESGLFRVDAAMLRAAAHRRALHAGVRGLISACARSTARHAGVACWRRS